MQFLYGLPELLATAKIPAQPIGLSYTAPQYEW